MANIIHRIQDAITLRRPSGLERPLWHDLSFYQGTDVEFPILIANGAYGFYFRAALSWGYRDPTFPIFWNAVGEVAEVYRTSYHVPYTDQPVMAQADNWYFAHPEPSLVRPIPRVIDLEVNRPGSNIQKADFVWQLSEIVLQRDGMRPWIYSRKNLIDPWLSAWSTAMLNAHYYILAQYLNDRTREHPGPPTLPNRIDRSRVLLHQTADKKDAPPGTFPVPLQDIDYNRWCLGTVAEMNMFLAGEYHKELIDVPPTEPKTLLPLVASGAKINLTGKAED